MIQLDLLAAPSARRFDPQTSRDAAETTRDLRLRKQMQGKLAELIAEENRRFTEGLPF